MVGEYTYPCTGGTAALGGPPFWSIAGHPVVRRPRCGLCTSTFFCKTPLSQRFWAAGIICKSRGSYCTGALRTDRGCLAIKLLPLDAVLNASLQQSIPCCCEFPLQTTIITPSLNIHPHLVGSFFTSAPIHCVFEYEPPQKETSETIRSSAGFRQHYTRWRAKSHRAL